MSGSAMSNWTKESLLAVLAGGSTFNDGACSIETYAGVGSSVVVSMRSLGDAPLKLEMNGEQIEAELVMFSLD